MTVEVEDINDNSPTFHTSLYTGFAREDAVMGTNVITTVSAFDDDLVHTHAKHTFYVEFGYMHIGGKCRIPIPA